MTSGSSAPGPGRRSGPRSFHFGTRVAEARADADVACNLVNSDMVKVRVPPRLSIVS